MNPIVRNIPNAVTTINVLAGTAAIICSTQGSEPLWGLMAFQWAYIFIGIAAVADFLDGFAARMLGAYSDMGKELDSLCDLVSFGVAPAMILFFCLQECGMPQWTAWISLLIPVAGAIRLARFNIDTRQTTNFIGLPIPANAIFWIGQTAILYAGAQTYSWVITIVIIIMAWLMNCDLPMPSLKFKSFGWKGNGYRWTLIAAAIILVGIWGLEGLARLIVFYVILAFFARIAEANRKAKNK